MARQEISIPSFSSERAEAAWWEKNRAAVETGLRAALREGRNAPMREVTTKGHKTKLLPAALRLAGHDLDAARKIAEHRGIAYRTYIRLLANEGD